MFITRIDCFALSKQSECLCLFCDKLSELSWNHFPKDAIIIPIDSDYSFSIVSVESSDEDYGIECIAKILKEKKLKATLEDFKSIRLKISLTICGEDSADYPVPGITLPSSFLLLCSTLEIEVCFKLLVSNISPSEDQPRCGAYYYLTSDHHPIDIDVVESASGSKATIIEHKGDILKHRVSNSSACSDLT